MKIIGGHDYYDGAGIGVDESLVFLRKEEQWLDSPFQLPSGIAPVRSDLPYLRFFYLIVGGEVFPGLRERQRDYTQRQPSGALERIYPDVQFHYELEAGLAALARYREATTESRFLIGRRNLTDEITQHFQARATPAWTSWMVEHRVITGHVYRQRRFDASSGRHQVEHVLEANTARLSEFEAYRVLDPATAHMRISNYIGGVLPSGPDTVELSDLSRLQKAGFHKKTSFRTRKGTKKPRRAKA